jgi:hypothetical protein
MEGELGRGLKSDPNPLSQPIGFRSRKSAYKIGLAAKEAAAYGEADSLPFKPSKVRFNIA